MEWVLSVLAVLCWFPVISYTVDEVLAGREVTHATSPDYINMLPLLALVLGVSALAICYKKARR